MILFSNYVNIERLVHGVVVRASVQNAFEVLSRYLCSCSRRLSMSQHRVLVYYLFTILFNFRALGEIKKHYGLPMQLGSCDTNYSQWMRVEMRWYI